MSPSKAVLLNRCPRCNRGQIFRGIYTMNRKCPECHYLIEKEPGYFLGAMMASYFFGGLLLIITIVLGNFVWHLEASEILWIGGAEILFLNPLLFRYSRLIWLAAEIRMTHALDGRSD